jgi:hypothetical protein
MVDPLVTHASRFLTTPSQAPKVFTVRVVPGVWKLTCLGSHNLHEAMVPRGFLSPDPPHSGLAKGTTLFRF